MGHLNNILPLIKWLLFNTVCLRNPAIYLAIRATGIRIISGMGLYEKQQFAMVHRFVKPGQTAVDVGANCGAYTLLLSRLVGKAGKVFAFEPIPRIHTVLKRNTSNKSNVTCYQMGLSSVAQDEVVLWIPLLFGKIPDPALAGIGQPSVAYSSVVSRWAYGALNPKGTPETEKEVISTRTLDSFFDELGDLAFVKIDVEGHETEVLKGARRALAERRPVVQFETFFIVEKGDWFRDFAKEIKYNIYILTHEDKFELYSATSVAHSSSQNYYLAPEEKRLA